MKDFVKIAWRNLFRNPRRTAASLVTVGLGAAGLLIYQGFNFGMMNQYRENTIHGYYSFGQVFPKGYYGKVLEKPWTAWVQNPEEVEKQLLSVPHIEQVFPRLSFYSFIVKGGITLGGRGEGVLPERESIFFNRMNYITGGDLTAEDEVILGKGLAESIDAKAGDTVTLLTQTINGQLNGADLRVAGVFHMGIKAIDDTYFKLHLRQAQKLLDTNRVELFALATSGVQYWDKISKGITAQNKNLESVPFEVLDKVYYQNSIDFLEAQFAFVRTIILLIVALGIFNTIAVGLLERAGEVGALRANGEKRTRLFKIFIMENCLLGLVGGALGVILAVIVDKFFLSNGIPIPSGPGITRSYSVFIELKNIHYIQALLLPMFTAVLASCWPVLKLLKKSIPDLLRST